MTEKEKKLLGNAEDLSGQTFHNLRVDLFAGRGNNKAVLWNCTCLLCGGKTISSSSNLKTGMSKSCGCTRGKNITKGEIGEVFGDFVAIKFLGIFKNKARYLYQCTKCGFQKDSARTDMKKGTGTKCYNCSRVPRGVKDITGQTFGRLTVDKFVEIKNKQAIWQCHCSCGTTNFLTNTKALTTGNTRSCGCLNREIITKHGDSNSRLYTIYKDMKARCYNPNDLSYHRYGGRGITICDEWMDPVNGYINFKRDMGDTYRDDLSIDRIDNNGNYCKENCRWSDNKTQSRNRSTNTRLDYYDQNITLAEIAERFGNGTMTSGDISNRLGSGFSIDEALYLPPIPHKTRESFYKNHKLVTKPIILEKDLDTIKHSDLFRIIEVAEDDPQPRFTPKFTIIDEKIKNP